MNRKPWFTEGWNDMTYEEQQLIADKYEAQREDAEGAK
mgnify:CR=1 FL=1